VLSSLLTDMSQFVGLGYSEDQEFESDEYAFRTQYHFGNSRMDRISFVGVLLELENAHGGQSQQESENPIEAMIERHYRTHPSASDRVGRLLNMPDDPNKP